MLMKRILLLALSLVLITTANLKSQNVNPNTEIIIGEGTNTTTSLPINTNYRYNYSQQLYLASEMGGGSVIDKIYLQYMSAETTRTIDIYMGNTDKTSGKKDWLIQTVFFSFACLISLILSRYDDILLVHPYRFP